MAGGASAGDQARLLREQAAQARVARQAGAKTVRGKSETAYNKTAKAWEAGQIGEERTARRLDRLRGARGWVLHDRLLDPAKKWNLDHLVIVPSGVYFVDSKQWKGRVTPFKGGLWRHYTAGPKSGRKSEDMTAEVLKIRGMAESASQRLGSPVIPVLCLTGTQSRQFEGVETVSGVLVMSVDTVYNWLRDAPAQLSDAALPQLAAVVSRVFPPATTDTAGQPAGILRAIEAAPSPTQQPGPVPTAPPSGRSTTPSVPSRRPGLPGAQSRPTPTPNHRAAAVAPVTPEPTKTAWGKLAGRLRPGG